MQRDPALQKLTLGSLDDIDLAVVAQYNPKELEIAKQVPWIEHDVLSAPTKQKARAAAIRDRGALHLEFTARKGRTMSLELLFDGYERQQSIEPLVERLELLASPRDPMSSEEALRRPHRCVVSWGATGVRAFPCVIEALTTKYTMFHRDGTPLRALCSVKLKEATIVSTSAGEREQFSGVKRKPAH
jgi:hypothetical protein